MRSFAGPGYLNIVKYFKEPGSYFIFVFFLGLLCGCGGEGANRLAIGGSLILAGYGYGWLWV